MKYIIYKHGNTDSALIFNESEPFQDMIYKLNVSEKHVISKGHMSIDHSGYVKCCPIDPKRLGDDETSIYMKLHYDVFQS